MTTEFTGRVRLANGRPLANVRVRVYDKDEPGKTDDDLTISEGLSDAEGRFTVRFDRSKYLDFNEIELEAPGGVPFNWARDLRTRVPDVTDVYLPYLEFRYHYNGQPRTHTSFMRPFQREFRLPELPAVPFKASVHGFKFVNRFPGYFIPFSVPSLPDIPSTSNAYGMCGGMCAASYDFALAERPIPAIDTQPKRKTPLHQYIYKRQMDSLGPLGDQVVRFARWMALPDGTTQGTHKRTYDEFELIRARLDDGNPVPIGLVYVSTQDTLQIWANHQVLAIGYTENEDATVDVHVYDPNFALRDDVIIHCERVAVGSQFLPGSSPRVTTILGLSSVQRVGGRKKKNVRGFFAMPYTPVTPPDDL